LEFTPSLKDLNRKVKPKVVQMIKKQLGVMLPLKFFFWLLETSLPPVLKSELEGMADEADDISFNDFVTLNLLYNTEPYEWSLEVPSTLQCKVFLDLTLPPNSIP
jgi:hypothetical protein